MWYGSLPARLLLKLYVSQHIVVLLLELRFHLTQMLLRLALQCGLQGCVRRELGPLASHHGGRRISVAKSCCRCSALLPLVTAFTCNLVRLLVVMV